MLKESKYILILFYRNANKQSLQIKMAINDLFAKYENAKEIKFKEVNYDLEKVTCLKYGIKGIPSLLLLKEGEIIGRFLGEVTSEELEIIIRGILKK